MENINLIRKIAWSFHRTTGIDWDDLFQEASLSYCEALKNYDPAKGKLSTYMWWRISSHLTDVMQEHNRYKAPLEDSSLIKGQHDQYQPEYVFENLSKDAMKIMDVILSEPEEVIPFDLERLTVKIIKKFKDSSWYPHRVRWAINDLKMAFSK